MKKLSDEAQAQYSIFLKKMPAICQRQPEPGREIVDTATGHLPVLIPKDKHPKQRDF
jgi:hypothetical protein